MSRLGTALAGLALLLPGGEQLAALEREAGTRLLERTGRRVEVQSVADKPLCRNGFYLVQGNELVRFDERAQRHLPVSRLPVTVNALAYSQQDESFYGIGGKQLVTITADGTLTDRGPVPAALQGAYAAASDGTHWLLQVGTDIVAVQIPALTVVSKVSLSEDLRLGDWDINSADGMIYGVAPGRQPQLVRIDPATGAAKAIATPPGMPPGSSFGAAAIDIYGTLHVLHNSTGRIYHIPLPDPEKTTSSALDLKAFHADAASCPAGFDYGNKPQSTARHTTTTFGTLAIGAAVGKDDGATTPVTIDADATSMTLAVAVGNTTEQPALLAGWHDLDHDGQFTAAERAQITVRPGDTSVTLVWPQLTVDTGSDDSSLRLRLFGVVPANPMAEGFASGGEVEDYALTVRWPMPKPHVRPPSPSLSPSPTPSATAAVAPAAVPPVAPKRRMPLTLTLFAGLLVPVITVAARKAGR